MDLRHAALLCRVRDRLRRETALLGTSRGPPDAEGTGPTPLSNGDVIRLGSLVVTIHASANAMTTETVERPQ
jgi:hypothetical protein